MEIYLNGHLQLLIAKFQKRGRGEKEDDEREECMMTKLVESLEKLQNKHPSNPDPWPLVYLFVYCLSYTVIMCSYTLYMSVLHVAIWNERNKNCSHCGLYNELFNTPSSVKVTAMVSLRYLINVILAFDNIFHSKNLIRNIFFDVHLYTFNIYISNLFLEFF